MAAFTICSDFGAPQNKVSHCFHCFPIYLPWSDGRRIKGLWKLPDGRDWLRGNWVLLWWAGPCSVNLQSTFLLIGRAVFPPCYLTWGETMVEMMKIIVTSFERSHARTVALSAPSPAAGHHRPMPPPEIPGHSWATLGQSLVGPLLPPPGSWCTQVLFVPSKSLSPQSCVSSGNSMVGLMATSSKRTYAIPGSTAPITPAAAYFWPIPMQETLKHSSVSVSVGSLGPGVHKICLSPLSMSGKCTIWFYMWFRPSCCLSGASPLPLDVG